MKKPRLTKYIITDKKTGKERARYNAQAPATAFLDRKEGYGYDENNKPLYDWNFNKYDIRIVQLVEKLDKEKTDKYLKYLDKLKKQRVVNAL